MQLNHSEALRHQQHFLQPFLEKEKVVVQHLILPRNFQLVLFSSHQSVISNTSAGSPAGDAAEICVTSLNLKTPCFSLRLVYISDRDPSLSGYRNNLIRSILHRLCELGNLSTKSGVLGSDSLVSEPLAQSAAQLAVRAERSLRAVGCCPR